MRASSLENAHVVVFSVYVLQLSAMLAFSFVPEGRVWGIGTWEYLGTGARITLFVLGLCVGIVIYQGRHALGRLVDSLSPVFRHRSVIIGVVVGLVGGLWLLYAFARPGVFLLGDGYETIDHVATHGSFKVHEAGAVGLHRLVVWAFGLEGFHGAQLAVQCVSTVIGTLVIVLCVLVSQRIFRGRFDGLVLALGVLVGGYSLQFVGYAENYALFIFFVILFVLWGVVSLKVPSNRWWLVPITVGAIGTHVFGVTLLPAMAYVVMAPTALGRRMTEMRPGTLVSLVLVLAVAAFALVHAAGSRSYFVYHAILPLSASEFTPDGYSLFSAKHLLDMVNLHLLVCPALPVYLGTVIIAKRSFIGRSRTTVFLILLWLSAVCALFCIDPILGMARDWDLFSFAAIPLSVLVFFTLVRHRKESLVRMALLLAFAISLLNLGSRIGVLTNDARAIAQFRDYAMMDFEKNRKYWYHLVRHHELVGDMLQADRVRAEWAELYPDRVLVDSARAAKQRGDWMRAQHFLTKAQEIDASNADIYSNLGEILLARGAVDSSRTLLDRALKMNPADYSARNNLATVYLHRGQYAEALGQLKKAHELFPEGSEILYNMAGTYRILGHSEECRRCLLEAAERQPLFPQLMYEVTLVYLREGKLAEARSAFQQAIDVGLDEQRVQALNEKVPQLRPNTPAGQQDSL